MKKKTYQKPATRIAKVQNRLQMLSASGGNGVQATMSNKFYEEDLGE